MDPKWIRLALDTMPMKMRLHRPMEPSLERRLFTLDGQMWPLLALTTYRTPSAIEGHPAGITLHCAFRADKKWWLQTPIPQQLIEEAVEMLGNAESKP